MMNFKTLGRRLGLGLLGVALLGAMVVVVLRSGPLAPVRVTVVRGTIGSVIRPEAANDSKS